MSLFDFPRINISGTLTLVPGTANNDDYAGSVTFPDGPNKGQTLALIDSKLVQPRTYGMADDEFIAWVQKRHPFDPPVNGKPQMIIPAEWNYYGDMSSRVSDASVIGVQTSNQLYTTVDPAVPVTSLIGAPLTYYGGITDVNSEGSPPATQFFIEQLTLGNGSNIALQGPASKGACQWLNFYRNVNLTEDGGAGGYVYHVILKSKCGGKFNIPGFEDPSIIGAIFRYYLYRSVQRVQGNDNIEKMYAIQGQNAADIQFVATIAPLRADEVITTGPVGRLLVAPPPSISTQPLTKNNGGGTIALAPAVLQQDGNRISVDFVGTFPDNNQPASNDKYDFGPVELMVDGNGTSASIGNVHYLTPSDGDRRGWLFDFDISGNPAAQKALTDPAATFRLSSPKFNDVLNERDYYIVSNQQAVYAEQNGAPDSFMNQGTAEPATISVYQHGKVLPAGVCPPITVWSYSTVPLQTPGALVQVAQNFNPGDLLTVDVSRPGNFTFTFTVDGQPSPPPSYNAFLNPPFTTLTNSPQLCMRILPNEDYSHFYVDPSSPEPIGNDSLTFDIVYGAVLRTYYLLYPIMNKHIPLNSEQDVANGAGAIIARTDPSLWMSIHYMPRTRDMSSSRRTLLQAWCRKQPKPHEKKSDARESRDPKPWAVYLLAYLLLAFPVLYAIDWKVSDLKEFWTYRLTLIAPISFIFLALVPGVLAIVYHLVTLVQSGNQSRKLKSDGTLGRKRNPWVVYLLAYLLLAFPVLYSIDWKITEKFWTYRLTLGAPALFIFLAFVPGVLAIVYHLVTVVQRRNQNIDVVNAYYTWLSTRGRAHQKGLKRSGDVTTGPLSANAATIMLVAVFLFVAIIAGYMHWDGPKDAGLRGVVYAGLGAYVAVLYFMISRLYASALSSRFLMSSAIGTASAIVMGWIFGTIGASVFHVGPVSLNFSTVLFLTGLFHKWAFDAMRQRARKLFGQPDPETTEMPLDTIEGVDDVHADLLSEYGVSTVQHLATAEPGELCERTLLPLDRITEWMDQAILVKYLNKGIVAARSLGIRGATDLIMIYIQASAESPAGPMSKLLDSLSEKITMPRASIDAIADKLHHDYTVGLVYELREGQRLR